MTVKFYLVNSVNFNEPTVQRIKVDNGKSTLSDEVVLPNCDRYVVILSKYKDTKLINFNLESIIAKEKVKRSKSKLKKYKMTLLEGFLDKLGGRISRKIQKNFEGTHDKEAKYPIDREI